MGQRAPRNAEDDGDQAAMGDAPAALRDELVDEMSYEVRTSLQALLGWCKVLREGKPDAERRRRALLGIEDSAAAIAGMLDQTQELRGLVSDHEESRREEIDLRALLQRVVAACTRTAEARGVTLTLDLGHDVDVAIGDAPQLARVLERLLRDAVRLAPARGTVVVRAARRASDVEVELVGSEGSEARGGTEDAAGSAVPLGDSGAAVLQRVVQRQGGALIVPRDGSPARLRLPCAVSRPGSETTPVPGRAASPRRAGMARPLEGVRVLVVDDETDARDLAAMVLTQAGAEVHEASSATEALRVLARHRPDVVVSDIGMPGQDGHSLIRTIRDLPSPLGSIRAMAVTAFARSEDRHRSLDAGFDMHVVKPVDPTNLVGSVARLVGRDPTVAA